MYDYNINNDFFLKDEEDDLIIKMMTVLTYHPMFLLNAVQQILQRRHLGAPPRPTEVQLSKECTEVFEYLAKYNQQQSFLLYKS